MMPILGYRPREKILSFSDYRPRTKIISLSQFRVIVPLFKVQIRVTSKSRQKNDGVMNWF
jgi:hypothetical protein